MTQSCSNYFIHPSGKAAWVACAKHDEYASEERRMLREGWRVASTNEYKVMQQIESIGVSGVLNIVNEVREYRRKNMATDRDLLKLVVDSLLESIEHASPEEIDELLRAGLDPVKLAEHYQAVAEAAMKERQA